MTQPVATAGAGQFVLIVTATSNQPAAVVQQMRRLIQLGQTTGKDAVLGMHLVQSVDNPAKFVFVARYRSAEARLMFRKTPGFIEWDEGRKASGVFLSESYEFFNDVGIGFTQG